MKYQDRIKLFKPFGYIALVLLLGIIVMLLFTKTKLVDILTFEIALLIYAVLPGYCIFINVKMGDWERAVFSIPLSIVVVSSLVYLLNVLLGIPISILTTIIVILVISLIGFFWPEIKSNVFKGFRK